MATFKLHEPIKRAIIDRLEADPRAVLAEINSEADDGYELRPVRGNVRCFRRASISTSPRCST